MRLRFASVAELELAKALDYYESCGPGLGARFLAEVQLASERIETHPLAWRRLSPNVRRCLLHRFPYGIFYRVHDEEIEILSVGDLRQDPRRWEEWIKKQT